MIWKGSEQELIEFVTLLNTNQKNIKLTLNYSPNVIEFLDLSIYRDQHGFLQTDVYRKTTAVNALLHASASHPAPTKTGIPVGQFFRARKIYSSDDSFSKQASKLTQRFKEGGYRKEVISRGLKRATEKKREDLLAPKKKQEKAEQVSFSSTYSGSWREIRDALQRHSRHNESLNIP